MFIQPSLTQNQVDVILPVGEYISIGNTGNESTTVLLQSVALGAQPWIYSTIGTLSNTAQTFGPYTAERTIQIQNRNATVEYSIGAQPQLRSFPALVLENKGPIGLVEPAATFVTLTYNTNAGNVRLVSAGIHGLTAAISVGASVYVTWSGGTGVNGLYEVLSLDADTIGTAITIDLAYVVGLGTPTVAVANTAVTLASVTVPSWSMGTGGEIEINALFSMTNSANAKNIGMTFGGGAILTLAAANIASVSVQKDIVNRGGSQIVSSAVGATGHGASTGTVVTLSVNTNVDQTFAITAQPTTANELVQLEYYNMHILF